MEPNYDNLINEWHPTKNGDKKFTDFTRGSNYNAWWSHIDKICGCLHEWKASIGDRTRLKPRGCTYCSKIPKKVCIHKSLAFNFPDLIKEWNYAKNIGIDPKAIPIRSNKLVSWECNKSKCGCPHIWNAAIADRTDPTNPTGCPFCSHKSPIVCIHDSLAFNYPELMKEWSYGENVGIDPTTIPPKSNKMVVWECNKSKCGCPHIWDTVIAKRTDQTQPTGCPFCSPCPTKICIHDSLEYKCPEITKEWDIVKNGDLKPSQISCASNMNIWWKCRKKGHSWDAVVGDRTGINKTGCPRCKYKTAAALLDWLIEQLSDCTIKPEAELDWCCNDVTGYYLPYDFYLVEYNKIIELDGPQHFQQISNWKSHEETRKRDIYKMKLALDHGISVIRITQTMFKNRQADMNDILLPHILNEELACIFLCDDDEYKIHKAMFTEVLKY